MGIAHDKNATDTSALNVRADVNGLLRQREAETRNRLAVDPDLYRLGELDCLYEQDQATLWTYMNPIGRPSFNPSMLDDFRRWQNAIRTSFGPDKLPLSFLVLGSRCPGVFCYGGDLDLFVSHIRAGNREALVDYGRKCVGILHRNMHALDLPMVTIGLVEGDALGGGFEALLSFDLIIAEKGSKFGLPETMFGLFPGMGAHCILSRKLGTAMAERMIMGGKTYIAEELYDMGLVHELVEPGEGVAAVRKFIRREKRRLSGRLGSNRAMNLVADIRLEELQAVVELWADSALKLREQDLKLMLKLVSAQTRVRKQAMDDVTHIGQPRNLADGAE
ncbi:MAG: crotonase/enoyl-CoA hydratase family protein [Pseudomonadota bacterium]